MNLSYLFNYLIYLSSTFIYLFLSIYSLFSAVRRPFPDFTDSFAQRRRSRQPGGGEGTPL